MRNFAGSSGSRYAGKRNVPHDAGKPLCRSMPKQSLEAQTFEPPHKRGDTVTVILKDDLRLTPTPLDDACFSGSKVYCYFEDFGTPVKTHVGFMENSGTFSGKLKILTSGTGCSVKAKIL